jgi:A/G-specific adenine glycosylase
MKIAKPLLIWFAKSGRKNLPWQAQPMNPYHVWLSEIMLQQTQVATVINYFNRFIQALPTIEHLAQAKEDTVLELWAGLGYYARARNLHKSAKILKQQYNGEIPKNFEQVLALPGVGHSTAGAILSISFNQNYAILDGNVKRVLTRYHEVDGHYSQSIVQKKLWQLAHYHAPNVQNADYTQAIMDLGAGVCMRAQPDCQNCPIIKGCMAYKNNTQTQYPNPKPKKIKPTRALAMLIFINPIGEIWLEKRPSQGIWGGLWSFPEVSNTQIDIQKAILAFDPKAKNPQTGMILKHSFTHYHLMITPIFIHCTIEKIGFFNPKNLELGIPVPIKKILQTLSVDYLQ